MCNRFSHVVPKVILVCLVLLLEDVSCELVLRAYISQHGLHGEIEFSVKRPGVVAVRTALAPTLQHPEHALRWAVHTFPVDHRDVTGERCGAALGPELYDLTEELGFLIVPGKEHAEFETTRPLTGPAGLWGRSLRLESAEGRVMCASLLAVDDAAETYAEAQFSSPVAGSVVFRWLASPGDAEADADVTADLTHVRAVHGDAPYTQHKWKLFVTDIFDSDRGNHEDNCNVLQAVFDPESAGEGLSVGDLDARLGLLRVARDPLTAAARATFKHDVVTGLRADMQVTRRSLYLVVYDHQHEDSFLACAKLRLMPPQSAKVLVSMEGVRGTVELTQRSPWAPTWLTFALGAADPDYEANLRFVGSVLHYSIRELPPDPAARDHPCNTTGPIFNPSGIDLATVPPPGMGTQEQYAVGDLLGKLLGRAPRLPHAYLLPGLAPELAGAYWDAFLPLRGRASARHRALLVERRAPKRDVCGTVVPYEWGKDAQTPMSAAEAVYRYPLVGRVVFRQPKDRPWEDTTITIERLIHADGSNVNDTFEHRWALHEHAPGADFYNWSRRCESAGAEWEPRPLAADPRRPEHYCSRAPLCRLGDLSTRHGLLTVAGRKRDAARTRRHFVDPALALAGRYSALRRSLLILDDHGPVARGDRMACSIVGGKARRKAVVHDWFGEGAGALAGRLELTQQTEYDVANLHLKLDGLDDVDDYRIHVAPVQKDLEFPCEISSLLDTYNPYHVNKSTTPAPTRGTADEYPVGALGEKFGLLTGLRRASIANNDTQLTLFGARAVLGRSLLLLRAGARGRRWACGSLERGYSPSEARELRALASFHHPGGFAWGYVRMTQLVGNDGGASDTVIEVNLRYPGERDRNMTYGHRWEIFVNPVGVDAAVAVPATRCVAGGYRWNPYYTQLADPLNSELYNEECGADNPLRCDVGDLTSRLGTIDLGVGRQVFTDSNFPLEGAARAVGRSLVVFAPDGGRTRFACANIEEDNDIVKYVNIMKPPRFAIGQFLADVRRVLGAPAWLLWAEARRARALHHGACLQLLMHFAGARAAQLEQDFTRLLATGRLEAPTLSAPGFVDSKRKRTTSYRQCGVVDPSDRKREKSSLFAPAPPRSRAPPPRMRAPTPRLRAALAALLLLALV